MNGSTGNVVSFERSAAFMHRRAIKNRSSSPLNALELLRRALDKAPDNVEYLMDMAEVFYEMGLYGQSIRLLGRLLGREDAPTEFYYGLGLNFWGMGNAQAAQFAMAGYLRLSKDGEYREEVIDFLAQLHLAGSIMAPDDRRKRSAARLHERAGNLARTGEYERAEWILKKSLKLNPRQPMARALRAQMLMKLNNRPVAVREAVRASRSSTSPEAVCMAAQALLSAGCRGRAIRLMERVQAKKPDSGVQVMLIDLMCRLGLHERANIALRRALVHAPYDRLLLHRMAVSTINLGRPAQQAMPYWRRILRIDPDDQVAAGFLPMAEAGELDGLLSYEYRAPAARSASNAGEIWGLTQMDADRLRAAWLSGGRVGVLLKWAVLGDDGNLARAAIELLARIGDDRAEETMRDCLLEPALSGATRHQLVAALKEIGAQTPYASLTRDEFQLLHPDEPEHHPISDSFFRVLWAAVEKAQPMLGDDLNALFSVWSQFASGTRSGSRPLRNVNAWVAALTRAALLSLGRMPDDQEMAERYECSRRGMLRCARALERAAQGRSGS